jgi:hypothetical protein
MDDTHTDRGKPMLKDGQNRKNWRMVDREGAKIVTRPTHRTGCS